MFVPLRCVVRHEVLAAPWESPAVSASQDFVSQAADGPYLGGGITQFAQRIVYLYFTSPGMPLFGELFHFVYRQEGVVDKRIVVIALMDIDDAYSCFDVGV